MDLDAVDLAVVRALQEDGRATYESLARLVGLSRAAVRERVHHLLNDGVVRVRGVVHPRVLGMGAFAHVSLGVQGSVLPVAKAAAGLDDAPYVAIVAGRFPLIAELRSRDFDSLAQTIETVRGLAGVWSVDTLTYTKVVKDPHHPPGELHDIDLDDVDRLLLAELQANGRASYAALASRTQMSPAATRARVLRLFDAGVVHVKALTRPEALGLGHLCGFSLRLDPSSAHAVTTIAELDRVDYLAATLGRADAVGTLLGESTRDLMATLDQIRAIPGVYEAEAWMHLDLVKEHYARTPLA